MPKWWPWGKQQDQVGPPPTIPPELAPEEAAAVAAQALEAGDLARAASHVAHALEANPGHAGWRALLDQCVQQAPDPLALLRLEGEVPISAIAAQGYIHARLGQHGQALGLLWPALLTRPDTEYIAWAVEWVGAAVEQGEPLSATHVSTIVKHIGQRYDDMVVADEQGRQQLQRLLPPLERYAKQHPEEAQLRGLLSSLLRKAGRLEEARTLARDAFERGPSWLTATMLAVAHRALGQHREALSAYLSALEHDPKDLTVRLDIADMLCAVGQPAEGVRYYQQVLEREPEHPWALPHMLYHHFLLSSEAGARDRLADFARRNPDNAQARELHLRLQELARPYVGYLPGLREATINLLRQVKRDNSALQLATVRLSGLETPSARLALNRAMAAAGRPEPIEVVVEAIQSPDPREPSGPVDVALWRYEGTRAYPAVREPAPEVAEAVGAIAATSYSLPAWLDAAEQLAQQLHPEQLNDLLGLMAHASEPPPQVEIWNWIHRLQMASAVTLAAVDDRWPEPRGRATLISLLRGPVDWSVEAAIVGLTAHARTHPEVAAETLGLFTELLQSRPVDGDNPYVYALACCAQLLPEIPADAREPFEGLQRELEAAAS